MMTEAQKQEIIRRAKAKGISDADIKKGINEYQKGSFNVPVAGEIPSTGIPQTTTPRSQPGQQPATGAVQPPTTTLGAATVEEEPGFVASFIKSLVDPAVNYLKFVGEAGAQTSRALTIDSTKSQIEELSKQSRDYIQQAQKTKDPAEKKRLLQLSRDVDAKISVLGDKASAIGNQKLGFFEKDENLESTGKIIETGLRRTAGAMSYVVPAGGTIKTAAALGAVSGALYGFSEDGAGIEDVLLGAAGGAAGGAAVSVLSKAGGAILSRSRKAIQETLEETATKSITKATPSAWRKAVEQHGLDLNALTKKFFPKGGTYDDLLGPIGDRGTGGIFRKVIQKSEAAIQKVLKSTNKNTTIPVDDFVTALQKEAKNIAKMPGNEANAEALEAFIKGVIAKYGKGITPKQLLALKRAADSKFGRAVVDEATGSATAQAQKMFANAARTTLKKLFPEIKEALETETEVYTIRPVLQHARAILKTQGSSIRVGSMKGKSLTDLINPISWFESYMADPKRASQFLMKGGEEAAESVLQSTIKGAPGLTDVVARTAGAALATGGEEQPSINNQPNNTQPNANQEQESSDINGELNQPNLPTTNLPQIDTRIPQATPSPMNPFGGLSKRQVLALALSSGAKTSDLKEVGDIYDMLAADSGAVGEETMKIANSLRTEYFTRTKENGFLEVTNAFGKVRTAPNTPAGDVSIVFAYMKMIDPGSVVREGEFATAENTAGVPERVLNLYNKALKGKRLSSKQRADFINSAEAVYSQYQSSQAPIDALYQGLAMKYGIDPTLVGIGTYASQ